jgi:zinc protease
MNPILPRLAASAIMFAVVLHPAAAGLEADVTVHSTPGGLTFRHKQIPSEANQSIAFAWKDGTAIGIAGKEGVPRLGVMLINQGPKGMSTSEFEEELKDLNADIQLSIDQDHTYGFLKAPAKRLVAAAELSSPMLSDPALPAEKLEEMKKNYAASLRASEANAGTLASVMFSRLMLGDTTYMRYFTVEPSTVEAVTLADIEAWRRAILVRDTLVITTAGPLKAEDVAPAIDRLFAGLPQRGSLAPSPKLKLSATPKLIVMEKDVEQSAVVAGNHKTVGVQPDPYLWGSTANGVLGGTSSGRLFLALREQLGATYGAYSGLSDIDRTTQALVISTAVANDTVAQVIATIRAEYARFLEQGVSEEELEETKTRYLTSLRANVGKAADMASTIRWVALRGHYPADYYPTVYEQHVRNITRAKVNAEIAASFPKALTIVVVTPSAAGLNADCIIKSLDEIARCE